MKITKIIKTKKETDDIKTITFSYKEKVQPGQFLMIWIPGVDEIPMSVSKIQKDIKSITFRKIGQATQALFNLNAGDQIGVRGPFGNGFKIQGKNILFVGGGTGIGMLLPAVQKARQKKIPATMIIGVKTKKEIYFENQFKKTETNVYITTDDGTKGYKGLATDLAKELLYQEKYSLIITCGPEKMMKQLLQISQNIQLQASLERYMKCAIGICGQCCIGEGLRVCKEGPVFDSKTLKNIKDFGVYKRDSSGKKIQI